LENFIGPITVELMSIKHFVRTQKWRYVEKDRMKNKVALTLYDFLFLWMDIY
jgi:hypothetical protein